MWFKYKGYTIIYTNIFSFVYYTLVFNIRNYFFYHFNVYVILFQAPTEEDPDELVKELVEIIMKKLVSNHYFFIIIFD